MKLIITLSAALLCTSIAAHLSFAQDERQFRGVWIVSDTQDRVRFDRRTQDLVEVTWPGGAGLLARTNGVHGSTHSISGEGFTCYYSISKISERQMSWRLMEGAPRCLRSMMLLYDP